MLTQGSVLETEEEMITQDGTKSSWLVHKFPIRGKDDAAFLLGGIAIDITERKRWEEALQESEAQLTLIMDNVPILIAYVDKELRYRFVNRTFERWHGRSATDIVGVHLSDIRSERAYHQLRQYAETALSGQQLAIETSMPDRHGGSRDVHATYVPHVDQQGNVQGYFAFVHDITERKQTEGRLRDVSSRLINAQEEERSRIARELHDDVNQKLALLAIDLELVGQTPPDSSVQITEHIQRLSQQVKDLSSTIHNLSHRLHPSMLERLGLVTAVESLCKELSGQHGIQIAFIHKDIRASLPDDIVLVLYRIVQECLQNVVKHSAATEAEVELSGSPNVMRLYVSDTGAGFDPESTSRKPGLGLISMQERLRAVDGTFAIRSRPSRGTRVDVSIPLPPATG